MSKKKKFSPSKKNLKPAKKKVVSARNTHETDERTIEGVQETGGVIKGKKMITSLRGMKDTLPKEGTTWVKMFRLAQDISDAYGYEYIQTPILEEVGLFIRSIGRGTDVVDKEMYIFEDHDGTKMALRPEATASIARAYIQHGLHNLPQPVKLWNLGSMFRHNRPQSGRYRQFHQFSCENLGVRDAAVDAELIVVAYNFLRDLGLSTTVHINSIGNLEDRERYLVELVAYLRSKRSYLSEESKKRLLKNPLRVLDSKEEQDQPIIEEAPQIIDWLGEESKAHFMKVLEYLDELDIPYILEATLVRGLDYYTDTVFEMYQADLPVESQNALGGGGRYDVLIEQLGGQPTPGCGFSLGLERIAIAWRKNQDQENGEQKSVDKPVIFFAHLGEQARRRTLFLIEELRRQGVMVKHNIAKSSLKAQLELANKFGATNTIILGHKELQDGTIIIRDMISGIQEIVDQKKIKREIEKIIGKNS